MSNIGDMKVTIKRIGKVYWAKTGNWRAVPVLDLQKKYYLTDEETAELIARLYEKESDKKSE